MSALNALSPLDGRYFKDMEPLRAVFSEAALIYFRIHVETIYLEQLLEFLEIQRPAHFSEILSQIRQRPDLIEKVKEREQETRHDVKAVEYVLGDALAEAGCKDLIAWIHWGLTSEDINNLAWGLMLQAAMAQVIQPQWVQIFTELSAFISNHAGLAMLARTHGQAASPTTLGKEYAVFAQRLLQEVKHQASLLPIGGKLNGATGNWHVFESFYPEHDWQSFSQEFVQSLGLAWEPLTTQIVVKESHARLFDSLRRMSNILIDACRDTWTYVSLGYFELKRRGQGEVGSSTMPHKVNPVMFENAEGNLELSCALFDFLSNKLTKSRLQRDLSDSTVQRNLGVALGHFLLGLQSFQKGLKQLAPRENVLSAELATHWEILAEPLQHALRLAGREIPYEQIRQATQGEQLNQEKFEALVKNLNIDLPVKSPGAYTGQAEKLAKQNVAEIQAYFKF
ncbi:adenylosuccinate lyase [bacterium (Candidatus Blackallbacteria) CG17_big_fil_post_rev_8_21_14_2_50_48_46]|uniref:Adenylosuccinate lyase n=1 Tax=bacterium (Candidatus Blackallbacteria) CG17_big_fil_post_rev_8_21_14_2_50_48_46 TaxID=2014261 RepID=A0A2M7G657_9BACT|nr:MAG: adenylosuccinate lyase [bacterium (Candidatus Blackallbacteria) CG18_big_fil_WC_8_21_14_2_50_49_26]PIW17475.1 MAG: adenylosuccinate lyase [bacterium (Candidatus Blackallbacteria) CG17_big_fil_post_rev_8_21_14_2_50_48_46]PIW48329.1 MAG: adenylosuccinate lyase [bacterium (Candidatus Blackallbacteria) CG13_big_fil_rev_8_21_14_2_50_49_14]